MRAAPAKLRLHRGTGAWKSTFNHIAGNPCDRHRHQHGQKDACPFFTTAPPGDSQQKQSKRNMGRPVAKSADVAHEMVHAAGSMQLDGMPDDVVQIKCCSDHYRCNGDANQPGENGTGIHKLSSSQDLKLLFSCSWSCSCSIKTSMSKSTSMSRINSAPAKYAILFFGCIVFHIAGTWSLPLIDRDEPRFAEASREMIQRGDYVVPYFNNQLRLDKPPLTYW